MKLKATVRKLRVTVPDGGSVAVASSDSSGGTSVRALLASLVFHGALVGVCASAGFSVPARSDGQEVRILAVEIPAVPPPRDALVRLPPLESAMPAVPEVGEDAARAAEDVRRDALATMLPELKVQPFAVASQDTTEPVVEISTADGVTTEVADISKVEQSYPAAMSEPVAAAASDAAGTEYWMGVRGKILDHLVYPRLRRGAHAGTNIVLRLSLDGEGRLVEAVTDSEPSVFALAAVRAAERAAPFAVPTAGIPLTVELPVEFRAKKF